MSVTESLHSLIAMRIPAIPNVDELDALPLQECGEPLALIPETLPYLRCAPEYHRQGVAHALERCYVRQSVGRKLERVAQWLGTGGRMLVVWDAWRPVAVQQALYDRYQAHLRQEFPNLSEEALITLTREFVALPSRDPLRPSPHLTGGAIDVTLADATGGLLPMGTAYDDFSPLAATRRYEEWELQRPLLPEEQACRNNRRLLYHLMTQAGFTNYAAEWWHFDYGNRLWAQQTGYAPIYGPIEPNS